VCHAKGKGESVSSTLTTSFCGARAARMPGLAGGMTYADRGDEAWRLRQDEGGRDAGLTAPQRTGRPTRSVPSLLIVRVLRTVLVVVVVEHVDTVRQCLGRARRDVGEGGAGSSGRGGGVIAAMVGGSSGSAGGGGGTCIAIESPSQSHRRHIRARGAFRDSPEP